MKAVTDCSRALRRTWFGQPNRLFDCWSDPASKIPHVRVITLGEMFGWAMREYFTPRNGRTSKALRALGYDVKIHSEYVRLKKALPADCSGIVDGSERPQNHLTSPQTCNPVTIP